MTKRDRLLLWSAPLTGVKGRLQMRISQIKMQLILQRLCYWFAIHRTCVLRLKLWVLSLKSFAAMQSVNLCILDMILAKCGSSSWILWLANLHWLKLPSRQTVPVNFNLVRRIALSPLIRLSRRFAKRNLRLSWCGNRIQQSCFVRSSCFVLQYGAVQSFVSRFRNKLVRTASMLRWPISKEMLQND